MKVVAKRLGYYNFKRQKPGYVFFLKDKKHFSKEWMQSFEDFKKQKKDEEKQADLDAMAELNLDHSVI